ncbi:hypothetical protein PHYPSEUDO_014002 [Phytophthora pseudosyringae]|uniref:Uncharacterized protein n=1 Tax=Phytophthora pseudosyringae TaxID=221518 RepID=A0A8T1V5A4_9STRA|nr:hypothetical protein PHYPSEUDO_014002 [Phytophthora pseudosyringae]
MPGVPFHLSASQLVYFARRYRAARNARNDVKYERLSETENFKSFKGHAEELRAKPKKSIENLEEEVAKLAVHHKEDLAKREQLEVEIAEREKQHKMEVAKLKESYEVEIGKLQSELNGVKAGYNALKEVMTGRERKLATPAKDQHQERERIKAEWAILRREKSRHDFLVIADQRVHEWQCALDKASVDCQETASNANAMRDGWAREHEYTVSLNMKLARTLSATARHSIEAFVEKRNSDYLNMTSLKRCSVVDEQMEKVCPEDVGSMRKDLDEFFKTRNFLCHQPGAVDRTDYPSLHLRCSRIQRCLEGLEKPSDY